MTGMNMATIAEASAVLNASQQHLRNAQTHLNDLEAALDKEYSTYGIGIDAKVRLFELLNTIESDLRKAML